MKALTPAERMAKTRERRKAEGFRNVSVVVHQDDLKKFYEYVETLRRPESLNNLEMTR